MDLSGLVVQSIHVYFQLCQLVPEAGIHERRERHKLHYLLGHRKVFIIIAIGRNSTFLERNKHPTADEFGVLTTKYAFDRGLLLRADNKNNKITHRAHYIRSLCIQLVSD